MESGSIDEPIFIVDSHGWARPKSNEPSPWQFA
jgi:hypothetical protein